MKTQRYEGSKELSADMIKPSLVRGVVLFIYSHREDILDYSVATLEFILKAIVYTVFFLVGLIILLFAIFFILILLTGMPC